MSETYISAELRRLVRSRASRRCEYCLISENDTVFGCEIDHIVAEKHGGATTASNLAYACLFCNRHKGTDLGSLFVGTGQLVRFYNPRTDRWSEHFRFDEQESAYLLPLTEIGAVTATILRLNSDERREERHILRRNGSYLLPGEW